MKPLSAIVLFLIFTCGLWSKDFSSWLSQPPEDQLISESADDQLGYGRLFIPVMTDTEWEPLLKIYNSTDGTVIDGYRPGKSVFLKPGKYTLLFGSSLEPTDLFQKQFVVYEQQTTIIEPEWSGLLVNIINENMEYIRYAYEILHLATGISAGFKYSKDDSDYDDRRFTWILPPGKYKIVKQGEPFNTLTNFTTFELKQGELTEMTIVINDLQQFIGSGELGLLEKMDDAKQAWHNYLNLKGSLSLFSDNKISEDNPSTKITFTGKIDNKLTYDANPYYLNFRQTLKEEWVKNDDYDYLNIGLDELKFTNTAIYYFTNVFGIYSEVDVETKIFDNNYYDINNNVLKIENNGDSLVLNNVENFKLSEPFSPLELQEEIGLNFTILRSASSNLYLRTGLGFIQTVNNNVYSLTDSDFFYHFNGDSASVKYEFTELENKNITGLIFTAGANFRFTNNLSYFSTLDFIYNLNENRDYNLEWENDLVFKIFKYLSIDYNFNITYDYEKNSVSNYIVYDHQLALEFSYYINR